MMSSVLSRRMYMKNNFFEPLVLSNIPYNFAVILPVSGRDTLCIYNDRKFALKAYGYFQSNGGKEYSFSNVISDIFGMKNGEKNIHFILSENTYPDLGYNDERESHIIFAWEGVSNNFNHGRISSIFYTYEEYIYKSFKDWVSIKKKENNISINNDFNDIIDYNEIENIERNIEERVSVIVYQGERISSRIIRKNKMLKQMSFAFFFLYIIIITIMLFIKKIL